MAWLGSAADILGVGESSQGMDANPVGMGLGSAKDVYDPGWFTRALMAALGYYGGNHSLLGHNKSILGQKTVDNPTGAITVTPSHGSPTGHGAQLTGSLMGPLGGPSGHGAQLLGSIVGGPGQPLGITSGGYANSPYGEFGPQYGMDYTAPNSPYGEFGPSQPGGYNMPEDIDGGSDPYIRVRRRTPDYGGYVDLYKDLVAAQPQGMSKADWGRQHWERHGGQEGRSFYGPSEIYYPPEPDGTQRMRFITRPQPPAFNSGKKTMVAAHRPPSLPYENAYQNAFYNDSGSYS